ncbi:hypothetical protein [Actinophytocola sp.]|uniref:hypothetical protein n=1 Tax=Actinophytocola sp. TaxID=1872138 RepID=UPI002D7F496B|nr:hypothetical protein [Actinophytocola sp.]HET9144099.1 hypothetical protein [Actinophytocola sp.]
MTEENMLPSPFARGHAARQALNDPVPTKQRPEDQVLPTPNAHPSVHAQVAADLMAREAIGITRYGTPLQPFNGRDADLDLYEELLDAAAYMKQRLIEKAAEGSAVFPNFMQAWEWMRTTGGYDESTPLCAAPHIVAHAQLRVDGSEEGQALFEAAFTILKDAGVLA